RRRPHPRRWTRRQGADRRQPHRGWSRDEPPNRVRSAALGRRAMRELLDYLPLPPRWATTLLGALALGTLVWYLGPTLGFGTFRPLASSTTRLVVVGAVVLVWLAATLVMQLRRAAADKKLVAGAAGGEAKGAAPAGAEIATLRQRLEEAQRYLKRLH